MAPTVSPVPLPSQTLRVGNAVAYVILVILVNILGACGWWGDDNARVSGRHPTPITPAGWAFAIWGLIFGLQGAAVLYQAQPAGNTLAWKRAAVNTIGHGWQAGWAFQALWQILFPRETKLAFWLCVACLLGATASFAATLRRLHALASAPTPPAKQLPRMHPLVFALYFVPTSINAAWLSVASVLGLLVALAEQGVPPAALHIVALVLLLTACAVGAWVVAGHRDGVYGLTLVWALVAVAGHRPTLQAVHIAALVCIGVVGMLTMLAFTRQRPRSWDEEVAAPDMTDALLVGQASLESQLSRHSSNPGGGGEDAAAR